MQRRARPRLDARHDPARHGDARPLRAPLRRARRQGAPARDAPPRRPRLARALHRALHRAHRGRLPALARAGAGERCCRSPSATHGYAGKVRDGPASPPASASSSTSATRSSATRSARPSSQKIPVMLVRRRPGGARTAPSLRGGAAVASAAPSRWRSTPSWQSSASDRRAAQLAGSPRTETDRRARDLESSRENDTTRINERIRAREIRVIGAEGEQLGVMTSDEARRLRAEEAGLDLVEVAPQREAARLPDHGLRQVQVRAEEEGRGGQGKGKGRTASSRR